MMKDNDDNDEVAQWLVKSYGDPKLRGIGVSGSIELKCAMIASKLADVRIPSEGPGEEKIEEKL